MLLEKIQVEWWTPLQKHHANFGTTVTVSTVLLITVFYAGPVTNAFAISDPDNFNLNTDNIGELTEIVNTLKNTYLNAFNNKTLFDKVYEELATDSYTIFETMNLDVLKKEIKNLTIHISNYQDLLG